jgi:hypothetical protein
MVWNLGAILFLFRQRKYLTPEIKILKKLFPVKELNEFHAKKIVRPSRPLSGARTDRFDGAKKLDFDRRNCYFPIHALKPEAIQARR